MIRNIWIGIGLAVLVFILLGVSRYNRLVSQREAVNGAWSQVENVLQRRGDLIPNLVETVKGYASHEEQIFTEVAEARSRLLSAKGPAETQSANQSFESALGRLLAISESYPDLKANQNFLALQDELAGSENRIAFERKRYNDRVRDYNTQIQRFPTNILAGIFNFNRQVYFEAEEATKTAPKVDFKAEAKTVRGAGH